jgi:hypothetical protein
MDAQHGLECGRASSRRVLECDCKFSRSASATSEHATFAPRHQSTKHACRNMVIVSELLLGWGKRRGYLELTVLHTGPGRSRRVKGTAPVASILPAAPKWCARASCAGSASRWTLCEPRLTHAHTACACRCLAGVARVPEALRVLCRLHKLVPVESHGSKCILDAAVLRQPPEVCTRTWLTRCFVAPAPRGSLQDARRVLYRCCQLYRTISNTQAPASNNMHMIESVGAKGWQCA